MNQYSEKRNIGFIFILLQTILYVMFLTIDVTGDNISLSNNIKFSIILLCFCFACFSKENKLTGLSRDSFFFWKNANKSIVFYLRAALLFTTIADLFILILDYYLIGVLVFIVVQQLYAIRLILLSNDLHKGKMVGLQLLSKFLKQFFLQIVLTIMLCLVMKLAGLVLEVLMIASILYFISLVSNVIAATRVAFLSPADRGNIIYAVAMFLFLLCDINVGLFNLSGFIVLPEELYQTIYSFSSILMWTFYAPSQILIALSVRERSNLT